MISVDCNAAPPQWIGGPARRKTDKDQCGWQREIPDARQVLLAAQQAKVMQG
jgi:hypothetical protein